MRSTRPARRMRWRTQLAAVAVTLVALLLSGCGVVSGDAGTSASGTRTVQNRKDEPVGVPQNPQRVVTLSETTLDGALSVGVTPVGTVNGRGQSTVPNYLSDLAGSVETVGSVSQVNFEAIANLDPDLILTDGTGVGDDASLEVLANIAPTFYAGYAGGDWHIAFENIAKALNREEQAERVVSDYEQHVADVSAKLAEAGFADKTYSIVRWQGNNASLILDDLPPGIALTDLGLKYPAKQDAMERVGHSVPLSLENIADADADVMFFGTLGGSSVENPNAGGTADLAGAQQAYDEARQVPGFADLHAVKDGRVILVDGSLWTSTGGPMLLSRIVDVVQKELLG